MVTKGQTPVPENAWNLVPLSDEMLPSSPMGYRGLAGTSFDAWEAITPVVMVGQIPAKPSHLLVGFLTPSPPFPSRKNLAGPSKRLLVKAVLVAAISPETDQRILAW